MCVTTKGTDITFGLDAITNSSVAPVVITSVALDGANQIALSEAFVVDIQNTTTIGVHGTWPPPVEASRDVWGSRRPAADATIAPQQSVNLVLHLSGAKEGSRFEGVRLNYWTMGQVYAKSTRFGFVAKASCTGLG